MVVLMFILGLLRASFVEGAEMSGERKLKEKPKIRNLNEWREAVLKRDNYTCRLCGATEEKDKLVAHHIFERKLFPSKALDINNGITLCLKCHKQQPYQLWLIRSLSPEEKYKSIKVREEGKVIRWQKGLLLIFQTL